MVLDIHTIITMDIEHWQPLTVKEVRLLFQDIPILQGIAGG